MRRTEERTKEEFCSVLLLFLYDVAATLDRRGFVAAVVVDGRFYFRSA
jgi:hypothetical protein